jgi:predicted glycosyltransferase
MQILIDINHPGQVHLFKHASWEWQSRGHGVLIVGRKKDVTLNLLRAYGLQHIEGTVRRPGNLNLALELLKKTVTLVKWAKSFKADILLSLGSPAAAWASRLTGIPHVALEDTEHSTGQYMLYAPFTDLICTPSCFKKDLGRKHCRYNGYHELAYLHPRRFKPNPDVLDECGLSDKDIYFVVRFVSWQATHDVGQRGFGFKDRRRLLFELQKIGRVLLTSEAPVPGDLEVFRIGISPTKIHDLLYYSSLYIGEGATMASEAAMLGTPSIYVNTLTAGTLEEQEKVYGLLHWVPVVEEANALAMKLALNGELRAGYRHRRDRMLAEKIDVTAWLVDLVERYRHRR